jgi:hypothetical protein
MKYTKFVQQRSFKMTEMTENSPIVAKSPMTTFGKLALLTTTLLTTACSFNAGGPGGRIYGNPGGVGFGVPGGNVNVQIPQVFNPQYQMNRMRTEQMQREAQMRAYQIQQQQQACRNEQQHDRDQLTDLRMKQQERRLDVQASGDRNMMLRLTVMDQKETLQLQKQQRFEKQQYGSACNPRPNTYQYGGWR